VGYGNVVPRQNGKTKAPESRLRRAVPCFAAWFAASFLILCATANAQDDRLELPYPHGPAAVELLHETWQLAIDNIYPQALADRFDAASLAAIESRLRADDSLALADALNPFLDGLGVSHTRFYDRRHQTWYFLRSLFSTRQLDEPAFFTIGAMLDDRSPGKVNAVLDGSPAARIGIRRGDRIIAVDGRTFESILQWQRSGLVSLTVESADGRRELSVEPVRQGLHRALADATVASRRIIDCSDKQVAYLHLWSGANDIFLTALRDAVEEANAKGLEGFVFDLRDGYGGAWYPYLDPFFPDRETYFESTERSRSEPVTMMAEAQKNVGIWDGPLAVLINAGVRSGKESLAYQFHKTGRGTLVGTTTAGAFSAGFGAFADRDADYLMYLAISELRLDGVRIEGVGVAPDIVVQDGGIDDAPLAAALENLGCNADSL